MPRPCSTTLAATVALLAAALAQAQTEQGPRAYSDPGSAPASYGNLLFGASIGF